MSPALREAMLACAQACADAGIRGAERYLQIAADRVDGTDAMAVRWLMTACVACEVLQDERFANGGDHDSAGKARNACWQAYIADYGSLCEHCNHDGDCSVCGRAA